MDLVDHLDQAFFDPSTSPGVDFYRHANGGWLDANPIPPEYPAWGASYEVHVRNENILHSLLEDAAATAAPPGSPTQMVGDYFSTGMDEEAIASAGIQPIQGLIDRIAAIESLGDVGEVLLETIPIGVGAFFGMGVAPDFEDADRYLVYVGQGGLGLPERDYYLRDDDRSTALRSSYLDHVTAQLENLGWGGRTDAEAIFEMEKRLAEASLPAEQLRDLQLTLNRHRVEDLDALTPSLQPSALLRQLGIDSETVNVDHPPFLEELDRVLTGTDMGTVRSYLAWHLVRRFASSLPADFEEEAFDFYSRKLGGQQEQRERWTRVLSAAGGDIGEQVAKLYVDTAFSPEAKDRCEHLVDGLLAAMRRSIESITWMSEPTREAALTKLDTFSYKIGYPDEWRDYAGLEIGRDSYAANRMRCAEFDFRRRIGRLDEPVDRDEWAMPAHVVNAYYHPLLNEVVFPAGILQPPFFYSDADDALNYGAIGTIIGHEITHGFDDNGSRFDEEGRRRNWWADEDRAEFERRAEMVAAQFAEYDVNQDQKVNGKLTVGENIADLGGLAIAYDAFMATLNGDEPDIGGLSPVQRFFLSYATTWRMNYTDEYLTMLANVDVHAPNPVRVNGPLSNFPPFAETFQIETDGPMRRPEAELIRIW